MAGNVLDFVVELPIPTVHKCVMLIIADDADKVGMSRYLGSLNRFARLASMSRRHLQRILRMLETWQLLRIYPQHRESGSETVHLFQINMSVDPASWQCPKTKGRKHEAYYVNFDQNAFFKALSQHPDYDQHTYVTWLSPLRIAKVERDRIVFRLPGPAFVEPFQAMKWMLLETAQKLEPAIKRIHVLPLKTN